LNDFCRRAKSLCRGVVAVTAVPDSALAALADHVICVTLADDADLGAVVATGSSHAVGALQAITQQGKADSVKLYAFCAADTALTATYAACAAQEPADYARIALDNLKKYLGGADVPAQVLQPLKIFINGQKPGPGEVG
jgi:ABC-type sugar transport system substrate-binding protein